MGECGVRMLMDWIGMCSNSIVWITSRHFSWLRNRTLTSRNRYVHLPSLPLPSPIRLLSPEPRTNGYMDRTIENRDTKSNRTCIVDDWASRCPWP